MRLVLPALLLGPAPFPVEGEPHFTWITPLFLVGLVIARRLLR